MEGACYQLETKEQNRRSQDIHQSRTDIVAPKQGGDESRGWFEEDAEFQARCALVAAAAARAIEKATKSKKGASGGGGKSKPSDSWETMSSQGSGSGQSKWGGRR